jgi:hypothetical protein
MANGSQKKFNGTPKARTRRNLVITRLEAQLKSGKKSQGELVEADIKRINKELEVLKSRV